MRTSNKILAAIAVVVILIGLGALIGARVVMSRMGTDLREGTAARRIARGDWIEKEYDFNDFNQLNFSGGWRVKVEAGDEYSILLRTPKSLEDNLEVRKKGEYLMIGTRGLLDMESQHFEARISMPYLKGLNASGGLDAELSGFRGEEMILEGSGGLNIKARDCAYTDLWVETSGGVNADLREMPVKNAHVDASGALHMILSMQGGELTGQINGAGSLEYYGSVSKNTLSVSGVSNIRHRQ